MEWRRDLQNMTLHKIARSSRKQKYEMVKLRNFIVYCKLHRKTCSIFQKHWESDNKRLELTWLGIKRTSHKGWFFWCKDGKVVPLVPLVFKCLQMLTEFCEKDRWCRRWVDITKKKTFKKTIKICQFSAFDVLCLLHSFHWLANH